MSEGLLQIEDCLDDRGAIVLPPGVTLISLIDRNIAHVGDAVAYRYLDYTAGQDGRAAELTWDQLGRRIRAIGARVQQLCDRGDRVAILAPQGLDYVAGFFGAVKAGAIAVPLFAPELQGHAERLDTALRDSRPRVVLTTTAVRGAVVDHLCTVNPDIRVVVLDEIPDTDGDAFAPVVLDVDDVSHLQYTSGATRAPVGVEVTHRAVGTNLIQMILSIDLLDRNTHGVSWLPLYHDMGLSMIGFPAVYGGHSTLLSPTAYLRRPQRWISALSDGSRHGRVVTAAPNFAYEYTAQRGRPAAEDDVDLSNVVMIVGSEPVSMAAIRTFSAAFAPYGLPPTAIKPSYGIAEATLFVSTIAPDAEPRQTFFDRAALTDDRAVAVAPDSDRAVAHVPCGQIARSQWAVIVDPDGAEVPDGRVGEIWLHGDNVARRYWDRPTETREKFGAVLRSRLAAGSHAAGVPDGAGFFRTGDLGVFVDGDLYVTGRVADLIVLDGAHHYPQDIEKTAADASPIVRAGYATAFTVPDGRLVIVAERASGTRRVDPEPELQAIRAAVAARHGLVVDDVRLVPAGAIPRTTSGKLARRACRDGYLAGTFAGVISTPRR
ncbi:fatty acyl-AMP ligase [Mycobacterium sp. WMMD1722]|uniref:fatty acyl-AMP ligase n=1 Tax=Mycobacterium sp. WMMD1722 TaxID=3404117 RepID=UPI003BF59B5B